MHAEAILFTLTTGVLLPLLRRKAGIEERQDRWRAILVGFFALGALRCILWTVGVPLVGANFGTLAVLGVVLLVWALTRGRRKKEYKANKGSDHSLK
jgi:Flp pilus assembly protein TadB